MLLEKTVTMRYLGLERTRITDATLMAAMEATRKRRNGIVLEINSTGTPTSRLPFSIMAICPLLNIIDHYLISQ